MRSVKTLAMPYLLVSGFVLAMTAGTTAAQQSNGVHDLPTATEADGPAYPVSSFQLQYAAPSDELPELSELLTTEVTLLRVPSGYVAKRRAADNTTMQVGDAGKLGVTPFHGSALQEIARQLVARFNERGLIGIYVRPSPEQIDDTGRDLRAPGDTALTMVIYAAHVSQIRTLASGERVPTDDGIDHPKHSRIITRSPVQEGELVDKNEIDEYIAFLNRHPGRRVDVALGPGDEPGGAVLDYMVIENKPWSVYYQAANTGTESTGEWRHRFGFQHTQLTDSDDIFQFDYITSDFDATNTVVGSYERPIITPRLRARAHGGFSQFEADELGFTSRSFTGDQYWIGLDLTWNALQFGQWFIDVTSGAEWRQIQVNNNVVFVNGEEEFFLVHGGGSVERRDELANTFAMVDVQTNIPSIVNTERAEVVKLGRTGVEEDFTILSWAAVQSVFIEPILWREAWEDATTPGSSTLAHELYFSFRGQTTFGERVAPQFEGVAGGMYTVRGYDESTAAGDDLILFTAEYRFHLPRIFAVDPNPYDTMYFGKPFRWSRQEVYGQPDWDLILKGFVDIGQTNVHDRTVGEQDENLLGVGVGAELQVRRNLNLRLDYGWALQDAGDVDEGDTRLHLQATVLY